VSGPDVDLVVVGLPNHLHREAVTAAARAGKGVLCTKPLGRSAEEAREMLEAVERAGVFHGYLEDLVYTPKTLKALASVRAGAIGRVLWTRSREAHPGPHSAWFWEKPLSGGGAIIDMGCHCIEIGRSFVGKQVRPVEVVCWSATQVHPIDAEDSAVGLVRYANGALSQFEVAWTFRGGMDLRDEVSGTEGTILLNHWLRTGFEMFSAPGSNAYVAEKAESESGWLFPVGDEVAALGYEAMFEDMLDAWEAGRQPSETFYDGYVVNAIMDACYRSAESRRWEPVELPLWRGRADADTTLELMPFDAAHWLIKRERMPDGRTRLILKDRRTGEVTQRLE
jgi:predicted dehydrogenase